MLLPIVKTCAVQIHKLAKWNENSLQGKYPALFCLLIVLNILGTSRAWLA